MDGNGEGKVVYTNQNVKKSNGSVGNSAGEFESRMERLKKSLEGIYIFALLSI